MLENYGRYREMLVKNKYFCLLTKNGKNDIGDQIASLAKKMLNFVKGLKCKMSIESHTLMETSSKCCEFQKWKMNYKNNKLDTSKQSPTV